MAKKTREDQRSKRKQRIRVHIRGTEERPRLCVFRSHKYTYAQLISDDTGTVITAASTKDLDASGAGEKASSKSSVEVAKELGKKIAELAKAKKVERVVFDRNGYIYHGRVAAVATGAREAGLQF